MKIKLCLLAIFSIVTSGCQNHLAVQVDVDSISSPVARQKSKYFIYPGNKDCKDTDLQFLEFAAYADTVLRRSGFVKVLSLNDADIAIPLQYGISAPYFYQYDYSTPIWGQTGISSSSTHGNMQTYGNSLPVTTTYDSQTTYTPTYGIIGSTNHVGTGVLFTRYLKLTGLNLEKFKRTNDMADANQVWSIKAVSVGESGDLRLIFPIMLAASQNHIAANTGNTINYSVEYDNKYVQELKNATFTGITQKQ